MLLLPSLWRHGGRSLSLCRLALLPLRQDANVVVQVGDARAERHDLGRVVLAFFVQTRDAGQVALAPNIAVGGVLSIMNRERMSANGSRSDLTLV